MVVARVGAYSSPVWLPLLLLPLLLLLLLLLVASEERKEGGRSSSRRLHPLKVLAEVASFQVLWEGWRVL